MGGGGRRSGGGRGGGVFDTFYPLTTNYVLLKSLHANGIWHIIMTGLYSLAIICQTVDDGSVFQLGIFPRALHPARTVLRPARFTHRPARI